MEHRVGLAEVRVRTQDGGLGVRGPDAAGVFGAVGYGGAASAAQNALQIVSFSNPADAAARLRGPLRDLVVQALSIAGTVCYAVPLRPVIGEMVPAVAGQGTLTVTPADYKLPWRVASLKARLTVTNTTAGEIAGAKIVPLVNGEEGDAVTLAGAARVSDPVADFGGVDGLTVTLTMDGAATKIPVDTEWDFKVGAPGGHTGTLAAIDLLLDSRKRFEWISIAGVSDQALWAALASRGQTAVEQYSRYVHFKCQARAPKSNESTADWITALTGNERGAVSDGRVQVYAGWTRAADPVSGEVGVRGLAEIGAGWSARRRPHEPVDAVEYGALPGVVGLYPGDLSKSQIEELDAAGYSTARYYPGETGVYVTQGRTLAADTSDFRSEERRRVMDRACRLVYERQFRYLNSVIQVGADGRLVGIRSFQRASQQPLDQMVRRQEVSAAEVFIDPVQDILSTGTIETEIKIVPLGKLRTIRTTISFRNPLLDAQAQAEAAEG